MTASPAPFRSTSKVPIRVSGDLCLRLMSWRRDFIGNSSHHDFTLPETPPVRSPSLLQPRADRSVTGKTPFNTQ